MLLTQGRNIVRHAGACCFAGWLAVAAGCSATAPNVRALRMVQHQEPTPQLLHAHIEQMAESLALIDALLNETPYQPGAPWVGKLALDSESLERMRNLARSPACQDSFVCLYNLHVREVLNSARRGPGTGASDRRYTSIQHALAVINPKLGDASAAQGELQKALKRAEAEHRAVVGQANPDPAAVESAAAKRDAVALQLTQYRERLRSAGSSSAAPNAGQQVIVRDAMAIASVALRLAMEASSLATVVAVEASQLSRSDTKRMLMGAPDTAKLAGELPGQARRIYTGLQRNAEKLTELGTRLSELDAGSIEDTKAFDLREGLVDEIVGFGLDSIHVDVQAGGNALFYNAIGTQEFSEGDNGTTYDYTGRQTRLEYDVEPIVLASAQLSLALDWPRWAELLRLDLGYATNRAYKSGGEVTEGSLAQELGATDSLSEALDAALSIANVTASVRIAKFSHGTARELLVADDSQLATSPLTFEMKQVELSYDFAPKFDPVLQNLSVGFRYFDYQLPRIVYELVNSTPGQDAAAYVFSRETPPQAIRTRLYMLSLSARGEYRLTPHWAPFLKLDFVAGYGPTRYYFLIDQNGFDDESNRQYESTSGLGLAAGGAIGVRFRMGGPRALVNAYLDAYYHLVDISQQLNYDTTKDAIVDVGASDLFHGPTAALGATF